MNCVRCDKPFVSGYLMPDSNEWMCVSCVDTTGAEVVHSDDPVFIQLKDNPQYLQISEPMEPVEFAFAPDANLADANSLRCCDGLSDAPRCVFKADWLTLDTSDQWDGLAWCQEHRPVKQKPGCNWWVPLRAVRVER